MNDGRSASLFASSRRHLGQINGAGLTETTSASLRGGGRRRDRDIQGKIPGPTTIMENYDVIKILGTGAFAQVYRSRNSQTDRRVALKFVILGGFLDSKRRKHKEQGEREATG